MSRSLKIILRILAGAAALGIVMFCCSIVMSFFGNPISYIIASNSIRSYVEQNFSSLDLEIGKVNYNFKFGAYTAYVRSNISQDTQFSVTCRNGECSDTYASSVLSGYNTLMRFQEEYTALVRSLVQHENGLENLNLRVDAHHLYDEDMYAELPLDTPFDRTLLTDAELRISPDEYPNPTAETVARTIEQTYRIMAENNCAFGTYGFYLFSDEYTCIVSDVTQEDIESGNLAQLIQEAFDRTANEYSDTIDKDEEKPEQDPKQQIYGSYSKK